MSDSPDGTTAELPTLTLTERAAERIRGFRQRQGHPEAWVSVAPAGLAGERLTFSFALVESGGLREDEVLVRGQQDIDFVAPKLIARHVIGSTVDADPMTGALELRTSYNRSSAGGRPTDRGGGGGSAGADHRPGPRRTAAGLG